MYLYFIAFCLIIEFFSCLGNEEPESGPFNYRVTSIKPCNDTGKNEIQYHLKTQHLPQRYGDVSRFCFPGQIILERNMDNNLQIHVSIARILNETEKHNFMELKLKESCSDLNRLEPKWHSMLKTLGVDGINECPIMKGTYMVNCSDSTMVEPTMVHEFPYGFYEVFVKYFDQQDNLVGCVEFTTIVSPKEKQSPVYQ